MSFINFQKLLDFLIILNNSYKIIHDLMQNDSIYWFKSLWMWELFALLRVHVLSSSL